MFFVVLCPGALKARLAVVLLKMSQRTGPRFKTGGVDDS